MEGPENTPDPSQELQADGWTPKSGLIRGTLFTAMAAVFLAAPLCALAYLSPQSTLAGLLNAAIGFLTTWILFAVMHRAAGQVGWLLTLIVVGFAVVVIASKHAVFAIHGIYTRDGEVLVGWSWLHPLTILGSNLFCWVGVVAATMMCRKGASIWREVIDILRMGVRGSCRR